MTIKKIFRFPPGFTQTKSVQDAVHALARQMMRAIKGARPGTLIRLAVNRRRQDRLASGFSPCSGIASSCAAPVRMSVHPPICKQPCNNNMKRLSPPLDARLNHKGAHHIAPVALLICAIATISSPAQVAGYTLENKTSYALSAAIAYVEDGKMVTRGWWRLRAGDSKLVIREPVEAGRFFVYAEMIPGHKGPLRAWSGDTRLCVENENLFTLRDQSICADDPRRQRGFFAVDIPQTTDGGWKTVFSEEADFGNDYNIQRAGTQRLLKDVGMDIDEIDGTDGPQTAQALRAYKRRKGLGNNVKIDNVVIDALIAEANEIDAKLGFFFCNATRLPVWAAIAVPDEDTAYKSQGWWRLDGAECAKVIRGALTADDFYVYGVMDLGETDAPMVGGKRQFCVADTHFDATEDPDCEGLGYQPANFRRIEIGGEHAWTFQFTAAQFNPEILPDDD